MANIGELNTFLRREDVVQDDIITFVDAGEIKDVDFSKNKDGSGMKRVFQISLELPNGSVKMATLNKTSCGLLSQAWGEDTLTWAGKKAKITFVKQLAFGKMTDMMIMQPEV